MKRFMILSVVLVLTGANLIAQSVPIRISLNSYYNRIYNISYPQITITSLEDNIEIKKVSVNKGHCILVNGRQIKTMFPKKLQYSEKVQVPLSVQCDVLRIDVETNKGGWSVEY